MSTGNVVLHHRLAEYGITFRFAVGIDKYLIHLRRESLQHVRDHRLAEEIHQSLVDAAHATALAACQYDACNAHVVELSLLAARTAL